MLTPFAKSLYMFPLQSNDLLCGDSRGLSSGPASIERSPVLAGVTAPRFARPLTGFGHDTGSAPGSREALTSGPAGLRRPEPPCAVCFGWGISTAC
jgi:hypothetical protein